MKISDLKHPGEYGRLSWPTNKWIMIEYEWSEIKFFIGNDGEGESNFTLEDINADDWVEYENY